MRIINKKYSMESFISRLPGVYPAYKDGELYYFDEASLNSRGHEFPTNYGMIPLNLVLTKNPTDITSNEGINVISYTGSTIMSWEIISNWYAFFKNYYNLLKNDGHCNAIYSSATEYYDTESKEKFGEELKYGTDRTTYENFDALFNERGGKVSVQKSVNCITGITDTGFYGWLNNNIISGSTPTSINRNIVNPNSSENFIPKIDDNINLSVSIDDIGEFSIFSKEYELGESYTSGETIYKDNKSMYISSGTGYDYDDVTMEMVIKDTDWGDYTNYFISKNPMYTPVTSTIVSGHTTSKLDSLCSKDCLIDDIGNKINGKYSPDVTYDNSKRYIIAGDSNSQPSEGEELELLYQVGNVGNIYPFEMSGETYFIGDIITDMYFYYEDISGNRTGNSWSTYSSSLKAIQNTIPDTAATLITDNILCNITYCVGATLKKDEDDVLHIYGNNSGITYYETVEFEKHNEEYHLKIENKKTTPVQKKDPSNHSVSYPVVCYRIKKKETEIDGENKYIDNLAEFKMETSGTNGMTIFPVLRQEYMFGSATMQNVDADIYIDRGINAAIDKHLKLGEVTSMEALENYSNGYFKIMDN